LFAHGSAQGLNDTTKMTRTTEAINRWVLGNRYILDPDIRIRH
jgi:hypothetical protein